MVPVVEETIVLRPKFHVMTRFAVDAPDVQKATSGMSAWNSLASARPTISAIPMWPFQRHVRPAGRVAEPGKTRVRLS